jgi:AcrR family transcriptional regulator
MTQMTQRMRGEDRRAQLIDVALTLFAEHGYDGASTRAIAAAAGVTEALIFRHFPTKRDLLLAVIERHSPPPEPDLEKQLEGMPLPQALEWILVAVAERLWKNREFVRMLLSESFRQGEAFGELVTLWEQAPRRLRHLIAARIAAGEMHSADPEVAARMLGGALFAFFQSQQHRSEADWRERSAHFIHESVRIFLCGTAREFVSKPD